MSKNKRPIINELPHQELTAIVDQYPDAHLRITRDLGAGKIGTISPGCQVALRDIIDGTYEKMLERFAGGGTYVTEIADPNTLHQIAPRWRLSLPGRSHDPKACTDAEAVQYFGGQIVATPQGQGGPASPTGAVPAGQYQQVGPVNVPAAAYQSPGVAVPQMTGPNQVSFPPADQLPPWARSLDVGSQWNVYYQHQQQSGHLPAGASMHSDQLATQHASQWQSQWSGERAENAKLRERLDRLEQEARDRDLKHQEELRRFEKERTEEKHRLEMERIQMQIAAVKDSDRGPRVDYAGLFTALAPVAAAFVQSRTETSRIESERTLKQYELTQGQQAQLLKTMQSQPSPMDSLVKLAPLIVPLMQAYLQNHSPAARAELEDMQHQSKMMQMKMMQDLIMSHFENMPETPTWFPAFQALMDTIGGLGQNPQVQQLLGQALSPKQLPAGQNGARQQAPQDAPAHTAEEDEVWSRMAEEDEQAAQMTKMVWDNVPPQLGFHTHEWRLLLFNIHMRLDPDELAPELVDHLQHCDRYQMLPQPFMQPDPSTGEMTNVFEKPKEFLETILGGLPIGRADPEYTARLVDRVVREIESRAEVPEEEDGDGEDDGEEDHDESNDSDDTPDPPARSALVDIQQQENAS